MKAKRVKRYVCYFVGFLVFSLILYSCLQDESDWAEQETPDKVIKEKNRELSVETARSWYEARQTPVVSTRSVATNFELLTKLHWKKGYENRKGKFEIVEIPLLTKGGAVLMDKETMEKYKETERGKIRNISRMVIIKNIETGEIINFVMHIVGTYEYLMKAKHFEDNCYLYRAPDLSGSVYFYEPEGGLVNGWVYEDGKIVGTISQGTEEGLKMQEAANTRVIVIQDCRYESVIIEYNECTPFTYTDPEYGLGFGTECRKKTRMETVLVCNDKYLDENGNDLTWTPPKTDDDNTGGAGGGYQPVAPKAKKLFTNLEMSDEEWKKLENLLNTLTDNCMGETLYKKLCSSAVLNGNFIDLRFVEEKEASYNPYTRTLILNRNMDSNELFHEMLHAYQSQNEKDYTSFFNARMNLDIEAHYAQYLYLKGSLEYDVSEWRQAVEAKRSRRHFAVMALNDYLDDKGNLYEGMDQELVNSFVEFNVVEAFKRTIEYKDYKYDSNRNIQSNFANLREITKNC